MPKDLLKSVVVPRMNKNSPSSKNNTLRSDPENVIFVAYIGCRENQDLVSSLGKIAKRSLKSR